MVSDVIDLEMVFDYTDFVRVLNPLDMEHLGGSLTVDVIGSRFVSVQAQKECARHEPNRK